MYPWLVCTQNNKIIGFAFGSTHEHRTALHWSSESAVLYETLFELLKFQGFYYVFAGESLPNEKSAYFYKALGFEEIGVFKKVGYKYNN